VTRRHPPKRARGGLILLAALALALALGPAGPAAAVQIDSSVLPRLACGAPPSPGDFDYWCGQWSTDAPTPSAGSNQSAIAPLGLVSLERVSEADVRPLDGRDFGAFSFKFNECSSGGVSTLFYAGRYAQGTVLACAAAGGSVLGGYWRDDNTSRSGRFTITTGSRSLGSFSGELVQHFLASNLWTGRCVGGWCATAVPPLEAPAPVVPPTTTRVRGQPPIVGPPLFRILLINGRSEFRSAADASDREPQVGWVVGAGDRVTAQGGLNIGSGSLVRLQKISDGSIVEVEGNVLIEPQGNSAHPAIIEIVDPTRFTGPAAGTDLILHAGRVTLRTGGASTQDRLHQAGLAGLLTPVARIAAGGGVATVVHDPKRGRTTAANVRGRVQVTPTNPALRGLQLVPGRQVEVTRSAIGRPFALVPDLQTTIPSPRTLRAGPALVTAPSQLSLRSLRRSKCVAVLVTSARPARVLVTIFSGRRSVRLFGQRLVVFTAAGRKSTCIKVPARAKTFNVRTPLSFAVGYALGARARSGQRPTRPVIRPIRLLP
jgi:hypothetical protein